MKKKLKKVNNLKNQLKYLLRNAKKILKHPFRCPERKSGFFYTQKLFLPFFVGHFGFPGSESPVSIHSGSGIYSNA
jgi:hypothetical protein